MFYKKFQFNYNLFPNMQIALKCPFINHQLTVGGGPA